MNRREFNISLAALTAAPLIPTPLAATTAPVGAHNYAWAKLIARAQNGCTPQMLTRHLRIAPDAAKELVARLLRDGVLQAPGIAGGVTAAKPITGQAIAPRPIDHVRHLFSKGAEPQPLVKGDPDCLGCDGTLSEEVTDARTDQPVQEGPA